jgi:hypothetical protein
VVAVDEKDRIVLAGECKWRGVKLGHSAVDDLRERVSRFRTFAGMQVQLALFSKAGFTRALRERARAERVLLFAGASFRRVR